MTITSLIASVAYYAFLLYFFVMWGRFIVDLVRGLNRAWRPQGFVLVLIEFVYTITDPPINFFRRIFPPLRLGMIAIDFGWSLTMLCCIIGMSITGFLR